MRLIARILGCLLCTANFILAHHAEASDCPGAAKLLTDTIKQGIGNDQANNQFHSVISQCPELAEGHFYLGLSLLEQEKAQEALPSLKRAIELKKESTFQVAYGNALVKLNNYSAGETAYLDALKTDGNSLKAMQGLSVVYLQQGRVAEAEAVLRKAIQISPDEASLFYNLGLVLEKLGRLDEAVEGYRAATERRNNYAAAQIHLGSAYIRLGKTQDAEHILRQASLHEPRNSSVWLALAAVAEGRGEFDSALQNLSKALSVDANNFFAELNTGIVLVKMGKRTQGIEKLKQLVEGNISNVENNARTLSALGWAYLQDRNFPMAEENLEAALKANPQDAFAYNNLGVLFELKGDREKAKKAIEHAHEINPNLTESSSNLTNFLE